MKKFIFFLIGFSFLFFIVITFYKNKRYNDLWKSMIFVGVVQNVVHIKNEKGSFFMVNDKWYDFSYNRIFEEQNFVGCRIEKRMNEEGIWLAENNDSETLSFYWAHGNLVKDSQKLKILN